MSTAAAQQGARWQFSLRGAFALTAVVAVASAAVAAWGSRAVVAAVGWPVALLNFAGILRPLQGSAPRRPLFAAAWLMFALSLVLPAAEGCQGSTLRGADVAWLAAVQGGLGWTEGLEEVPLSVLCALLTAANLLMLLSPLYLVLLSRGQGQCYGALAAALAAPVWCVAGPGMLVGYYVWAAAFLVLTCAWRPGWRTLAAMGTLTAAIVLLQAAG